MSVRRSAHVRVNCSHSIGTLTMHTF